MKDWLYFFLFKQAARGRRDGWALRPFRALSLAMNRAKHRKRGNVLPAILALMLCGCSGMYYDRGADGSQRFVMRGDVGALTFRETREGSGRTTEAVAVPSTLTIDDRGLTLSGVFSSSQVSREDWEGMNLWTRLKESFRLGRKVVDHGADVLTDALDVTKTIATDE